MSKKYNLINLIAFLFLLVFVYFANSVLNLVRESSERALSPINQISSGINHLSTEVVTLFNPTPTLMPDPITIIHEIRSLARLETIQYSMEKIITAEIGQGSFGFLFGDKLLFVGHGRVIAGIDLAKLTPEDFSVDGEVVYVALPRAEIFVATLDNEKSYVYDRETGLFSKGNIDLESEARKLAEDEILNASIEDGILIQAQINGENYLIRLFQNLGFEDVIFTIQGE